MNGPGTTPALPGATLTCLDCEMEDPPAEMTCTLERDHHGDSR